LGELPFGLPAFKFERGEGLSKAWERGAGDRLRGLGALDLFILLEFISGRATLVGFFDCVPVPRLLGLSSTVPPPLTIDICDAILFPPVASMVLE